jgi:hypothetical protein
MACGVLHVLLASGVVLAAENDELLHALYTCIFLKGKH